MVMRASFKFKMITDWKEYEISTHETRIWRDGKSPNRTPIRGFPAFNLNGTALGKKCHRIYGIYVSTPFLDNKNV